MVEKPARLRHLVAYVGRLVLILLTFSLHARRRNERDVLFSGSVSWFAL